MRERTSERVARLLAMIAYLGQHDEVPLADLAQRFGVTPAQARRDVETIWMTGNPGYLHGDLLDFHFDSWEEGRVTLLDAQGMERPVRLAPGEAAALVVALRAIAELPGLAGPALTSALAKLTAAAGGGATAGVVSAGRPAAADSPHVADHLAAARAALAEGRRLDLVYVGASDTVTERVVEPLALLSDGDQWYLRAHCLRAGDVRHFRLDRILSAEVSDELSQRVPEGSNPGGLRPRASEAAELTLVPRARWVAERFGGEIISEGPGSITVRLPVADPAWLDALALDLGPDLLALTPREHAVRVAAAARRALAAYDETSETAARGDG